MRRSWHLLLIALAGAGACDYPHTDPLGSADPDAAGDGVVTNVDVRLVPAGGVTGTQIVNLAVPLPAGLLRDATAVRVTHAGVELAAARRGLASYADGSLRSVQLQVEFAVTGETTLAIAIGARGGGDRPVVPVSDTLVVADGTEGPKVWAVLPSTWLAASGVAGPVVPRADLTGTALDAWANVCDYQRWSTDAFLPIASTASTWLYDRATAMYRGYAITGARSPLTSAYREAALYRAGLTGTGAATRIGVPGAADDLKYHYAQGLALHYLLTGDDRFREAAEDVAVRAHALWPNPGYPGPPVWTERNAGFALLAYEWAAIVSDDRATTFLPWAEEAVAAYLTVQDGYPAWTDPTARCFAHSAEAGGETFANTGCSPWMSAILAEGLETHAARVGGARAVTVRAHLVQLGRIIARHGRDGSGRPFYWQALGVPSETDSSDEHWGEAAYVVAMAWHLDGRRDADLRTAADDLVTGLRSLGAAVQLRSFNWQCRAAVMTPSYLR